MPLSDNLISAWELSETSGNATDSHGTNDLTETNGTAGTGTGLINATARDFEVTPTPVWFTRADNTDLSTGDIDFTFEAWIKVEDLSTFRAVWGKDNQSTEKEHNCYAYANGNIQFDVSTNGTAESAVATAGVGSITAGSWAQVIAWHDSVNNVIGIAVNAGTAQTTAHSGGVRDGTAGFVIGAADTAGGLPFDGLIGPVRFWKRVLSSAERTELYNSGAGRTLAYITGGGGGGTLNPWFETNEIVWR